MGTESLDGPAKVDNPWDYKPAGVAAADDWKIVITPERPADAKVDLFKHKHTEQLDALERKIRGVVESHSGDNSTSIFTGMGWLLIGGGVFGILLLILAGIKVNFLLALASSLIVGGIVAVVARVVISNLQKANVVVAIVNPQQDILASLKTAEAQINSVRTQAAQIPDFRVTNKIKDLCDRAEDVVNLVAAEPNTFFQARTALHQYLDSTVDIVSKLTTHIEDSKENAEATVLWGKFNTLLDTLQDGFDKQYDKILHNDLDSLDTEIEVLKRTIKMEGI